jgi:hypothetical protein
MTVMHGFELYMIKDHGPELSEQNQIGAIATAGIGGRLAFGVFAGILLAAFLFVVFCAFVQIINAGVPDF